MPDDRDDRPGPTRKAGRRPMNTYQALGIGVELVVTLVGMSVLGFWGDQYFGTEPWLALVGAGLGLAGGLYNTIRHVRHFS